MIGGAVAVLLVLGAGGAFLRLGMTATPPAQTMVHKDLSGGAFAASATRRLRSRPRRPCRQPDRCLPPSRLRHLPWFRLPLPPRLLRLPCRRTADAFHTAADDAGSQGSAGPAHAYCSGRTGSRTLIRFHGARQ